VYAPLAATRWDMTPARVLTSPRVHSDGTLAFRIGPCTDNWRANRTQESQGHSSDRKVLIFHSCIHDVGLYTRPSRAYAHFQEYSDLQVAPGKPNSRAGVLFVHGIGAARHWWGILSGMLDYDASRIRVKRSEFGVEMINLIG